MSSHLDIKELLNFFEKEVIPKLESIDANLETIAQHLLTPKLKLPLDVLEG